LFQEAIPEMAAKHSKHARPAPKRKKPARLAEKLLTIRQSLKLSQDGIIRRLGLENEIERDYISKFERGILEPTLNVLLAYARAISTTGQGEFLETLIDDGSDLPVNLPADPNDHLPLKRGRLSTRKKT
jgi:transcriptional regulator with XRE-family HTH domain